MPTKTATPKATAPKTTKTVAAKPSIAIRKDAKGRFWLVPKDGGAEQGPFDTKKQALDAKAVGTAPAPVEGKPAPAKETKARKAKEPVEKKLSAIDAAAQVLATSKEPLNCKELVKTMASQGLWSTPGGKTPHATLYSAIIREIGLRGKESRFVKSERGKFAAK